MKTIITLLLACWFCQIAGLNAQTVTMSDDIPIRSDKFYTVLGKMKDRFLLFRDRNSKYEVQAFDERMRTSWDKEIELDKKHPELLGVNPSGSGDFFSVIYKFRKKGKVLVKVHRYDAAVNLIDSVTILNYGQRFGSPTPNVIFSEDKSKMLIYYIDAQTDIEACAFDLENMKMVWSTEFSIKDMSFFRDFQQMVFSNDGEFFYIFEKNNRKSEIDEHHYLVYHCSDRHESVLRYKLPVEGFLTYDVFFTADNLNKRLVAAGLYSEKNKSRATGYYFLKMNPSDPERIILEMKPFDTEFIEDVLGKEIDKNKGLSDLDIRDVVLRQDGGMLMITERKREYERRMSAASRSYTGGSGTPYIVDYYYDDICLFSIHPDGELHWKTILHKRQYSQDDDASFSSYFLLKTPRALRFLFNDEIKDDSTVSEYVVNGIGDSDRNSVMSTADQKIRLRFRDAIQVASDELIVPSERRNRLKLVRVQY